MESSPAVLTSARAGMAQRRWKPHAPRWCGEGEPKVPLRQIKSRSPRCLEESTNESHCDPATARQSEAARRPTRNRPRRSQQYDADRRLRNQDEEPAKSARPPTGWRTARTVADATRCAYLEYPWHECCHVSTRTAIFPSCRHSPKERQRTNCLLYSVRLGRLVGLYAFARHFHRSGS